MVSRQNRLLLIFQVHLTKNFLRQNRRKLEGRFHLWIDQKVYTFTWYVYTFFWALVMGGSGSHICRLTPRKNEHLSGCGEDCFAPSKSRKSSSNWSLSFSYQIYKLTASQAAPTPALSGYFRISFSLSSPIDWLLMTLEKYFVFKARTGVTFLKSGYPILL